MTQAGQGQSELLKRLRAILQKGGATMCETREEQDGTRVLSFQISRNMLSRPLDSLDLSGLSPETPLVINVTADHRVSPSSAPTIEFKDLKETCSLRLQVNAFLKIRVVNSQGSITIISTLEQDVPIEVAGESAGEIELTSGMFQITFEQNVLTAITLKTGTSIKLENNAPCIRVEDACSIAIPHKARIDELQLLSRQVAIESVNEVLKISRLQPNLDLKSCNLTLKHLTLPKNTKPNKERGVKLGVGSLSDIHIKGTPDSKLSVSISKEAKNVSFDGPMDVKFTRSAQAQGIEARGTGKNSVNLKSERARLLDISGEWAVINAAESVLRGSKDGFHISNIVPIKKLNTANQPRLYEHPFKGAVLIGFTLPIDWDGRQVVAELEDAYHIDPRQELDCVLRRPRWNLRNRHPALLKNITQDAEFIDELARRSKEKGAPGSTRTKIAWWSYRLRHLASENRWERLTLAGYRALGYGERPIPAFLTWLALSLLVTTFFVWGHEWDLTMAGVGFFLESFVSYALGPIGALLDTGTSEASPWEYIARPIIAIPLVTGALALRNYVKQTR